MKRFLEKYFKFMRTQKEDPAEPDMPSGNQEHSVPIEKVLEFIQEDNEQTRIEEEKKEEPFVFHSAVEEGYQALSRYLSLRLYPKAYLDKFPSEEFFVRTDLDDTLTVLVMDYPSSVEHVLKSSAAEWNKTEEELFERALKNVQESYHRVVIPFEGHPQAGMLTLSGEDSFKTSAVLYLEEYPALQGTHGALVAFPDTHILICKAIEDDISLEVGMQFLVNFTDETYHQSEHRVSRQIYWYLNGEFTVIPYNIGIQRMNYVLPFELEDRLY